MSTHQAEYRPDFVRLAEDMTKCDKDTSRWQVEFWIAAVFILVVLIGLYGPKLHIWTS